jgi:hypothetical protein
MVGFHLVSDVEHVRGQSGTLCAVSCFQGCLESIKLASL